MKEQRLQNNKFSKHPLVFPLFCDSTSLSGWLVTDTAGDTGRPACIALARFSFRFHKISKYLTCGVEAKMSSKMPSSNNITQARRTVQQLKIEASIERIKVSKASADLMHYCGEHAKYDPLLMGIPASENPFKDKKPCTIL
ncbi:hypothetical protein J4Q44_G00267940 [Coregonus suidteri]|uniref:Guanine nucleotide-binding protein subunit gamma n=2 Tax=Coregonus TaxID=27772 RepID=A0AAN8KWG4_9TELE